MIYVLFSGGVDSLVCAHWAVRAFGASRVSGVFFQVPSIYNNRDLAAARKLAAIMDMPLLTVGGLQFMEEDAATAHVPYRNLWFLLRVAAFQDAEGVVFGMLKGEAPEDKNPKFVRQVQKLLDDQHVATVYRERRKFTIYTPFSSYTKTRMLRWYLETCGDFPCELSETVGCHSNDPIGCGRCWACINRWIAWTLNGLSLHTFAHPAETLISHISGNTTRSLGRLPVLSKLEWCWEAYRALRGYCRAVYGRSVYQEVQRRRTGAC